MRKCRLKSCRSELPPVKQCETIVQRKGFCDIPCLSDYGKEKSRQSRKRTQRKEIRKARERIKTRSEWLREAQAAVNSYIRERDKGMPCVSCGSSSGSVFHAGHYRSVGACPELRFNTLNINKQCVKCNVYLSSNAIDYRIGLISRYGQDVVDRLEGPNPAKKYSVSQIKRIKRIFNAKARQKRIFNERKNSGCPGRQKRKANS